MKTGRRCASALRGWPIMLIAVSGNTAATIMSGKKLRRHGAPRNGARRLVLAGMRLLRRSAPRNDGIVMGTK
jgi:hypothetical protein